jgi:regulatory protein
VKNTEEFDRDDSGTDQIRWSALGLLARREHSQLELRQKLCKRFPDALDTLDDLLFELKTEGLQSDLRFSEAYTRMRYNRGYGPVRVSLELIQRGVVSETAKACVANDCYDWFALAQQVLRKKFPFEEESLADKSKRQRFLHYRGFSHDHIQAVMGF